MYIQGEAGPAGADGATGPAGIASGEKMLFFASEGLAGMSTRCDQRGMVPYLDKVEYFY